MLNAKSKMFAIGDTKMHYVVFGKGKKTLLIIPGLSDGIQNVSHSAKALAFYYRKYTKKYTVYVCSRKNHLLNGYTTHDMARDIALFMNANDIQNAHIMGVSMGGMVAQHLAIDYPRYVDKLIIAVSSSKPNEVLNKAVTGWINMVKERRYEDFIINTVERT